MCPCVPLPACTHLLLHARLLPPLMLFTLPLLALLFFTLSAFSSLACPPRQNASPLILLSLGFKLFEMLAVRFPNAFEFSRLSEFNRLSCCFHVFRMHFRRTAIFDVPLAPLLPHWSLCLTLQLILLDGGETDRIPSLEDLSFCSSNLVASVWGWQGYSVNTPDDEWLKPHLVTMIDASSCCGVFVESIGLMELLSRGTSPAQTRKTV
ncbi:hypothetical protein C8Q70DRAFT_930475 [Cubamyces menziesii]|nr:hypothetical protein C8Q70DRAFT_930475 [Cubamyces menziesii]